jgi:hypothetical protein
MLGLRHEKTNELPLVLRNLLHRHIPVKAATVSLPINRKSTATGDTAYFHLPCTGGLARGARN